MRRLILVVLALSSVPAIAGAQDASPATDPQTVRVSPADRVNTLAVVQGELDKMTMEIKAARSGMLGAAVTGAPYSATTTSESVQALADGNRIVNRTTCNLFRDGQGRVRREDVAENGAVVSVMIMDPVANASYTLDPADRTVRKVALLRQTMVVSSDRAVREIAVASAGEAIAGQVRAKMAITTGFVNGGAEVVSVTPASLRREALGTQDMEGVAVEGTRTVSTIPAGQIGNERPIDTVSEQWYSKDLKMTIMSRHSDPRSGETTYRVTNLRRGEPDPTLFQVPGDYTFKDVTKVAQPKVVK